MVDKMQRTHRAFGLTMASAMELPHLPTSGNGPPDVQIRFGAVPPALQDPTLRKVFYQARDNEWLLNTVHIAGARFLVRNGDEVLIEQREAHDDDVLRLFLLGSCMGALLYQRGTVPLHGNAVATDRGAVVIAGGTGVGKSTLTMALHRRGYRVLADDICAVNLRDGSEPVVEPGFPRLKLWADTCERFGVDTNALLRIRPEIEKYHYPLDGAFCAERRPLHAVYLLTTGGGVARPSLRPLTGVAKLTELQAQLYKVGFEEARKTWPWLFPHMSAIAQGVRVYLVARPKIDLLDELADLIEGDFVA